MTVAESIAIREVEENKCMDCRRCWCRICTVCLHNSHFAPKFTFVKDETLEEYKEY